MRLNALLSLTQHLLSDSSEGMTPLLPTRRARKHRFLVSPIVLLPAIHEKLSQVAHLERDTPPPHPNFASICQEKLQAIPIISKFLHSYSKSQMSCILLGLLVFYWIVETSEGIPILLPLLQDHHSWSITNLTSEITSPPIHTWSLFTLKMVFNWIYCGFYKITTVSWFQRS